MQPISNNSTIATINPTQKSTPFLGENNNIPTLNSRGEAIDYIKLLTQGQDSYQFDVENTIGELKGRTEIPLHTLEFGGSEKQYYVTANMDPRKFFYFDGGADNDWDINTLNIQDSHTRQVVFIFGANFPSATLPVDMKLATEKIEELDGVYYVHCNPVIKFSLHELKFNNDEIKQKSDLINSIKLDPQRKSELIKLLENCSSRNSLCSNNDAVELCKKFPDFFDSTDKITPPMQINALKLANELAKNIN